MKKTLTLLLILILAVLSAGSQTLKRVLFIGNSYTYVNNLPQMLADVALSVNDTVIFDSNTPGGYTLQGHSTNQTTLTKIMAGNWDVVVLQEQSQRPSFPINQVQTQVFPYATMLDSIIMEYNPCAETMFYMTWGRKNGDAANCPNLPPVCTYLGMDSLLRLRYMMMAEMNDAVVSPVGAVWRYIRQNHPAIELYDADESHPSPAGTYAAAVCFYTTIFRKSPLQITFNSTLPPADATAIRSAVQTVVFDSLSNWYVGAYDPVADFSVSIDDPEVQCFNSSQFASEYYWDFGDDTFSNDENPVHQYSYNANFTITLIASHCGLSDEYSQQVQITLVGLDELNASDVLSVFPNPAADHIIVYTGQNMQYHYTGLYDIFGKVYHLPYQQLSDGLKIETGSLPEGVYYIRLSGHERFFDLKFVKF